MLRLLAYGLQIPALLVLADVPPARTFCATGYTTAGPLARRKQVNTLAGRVAVLLLATAARIIAYLPAYGAVANFYYTSDERVTVFRRT